MSYLVITENPNPVSRVGVVVPNLRTGNSIKITSKSIKVKN